MEGLIQTTSSQTKPLDGSNKVGVDKLKNSKPPLLPKPQRIKGVSPVITNQCSPVQEKALGFKINETGNKDTTITSTVRNGEKVSPKPPITSAKPQLPPKTFALNSLKSEILNNLAASQKSNSPPSPERIPIRPPRSPQKVVKSENDDRTGKMDLPNWEVLPKILSKQQSPSLTGKDEEDWTIKELLNDYEELSEFCKQVENCSKHSYILKKERTASLPDHRWKIKDESGLTSNNNSEKSDRVSGTDSVDSTEDDINKRDDNDSLSYVNGYERKDLGDCVLQDQKITSIKQPESSITPDVPKSFLHRYLSTSNQTKDPVKCDEKIPEKSPSFQSFLHKTKEQAKLNKSTSFEQNDSGASSGNWPKNSWECSIKNSVDDNYHVAKPEVSKKPENTVRPSSSDITSFSKRFPWFGSFGKGSKKDSMKKGRCFSQFYASSTVVDEQSTLREKSRTKSLPDIKQTRIISDGSVELKNNEGVENSVSMRFSGEYPHSDSDDDKDSLNQVELGSDKDSSTLAYLKARELMTSEEVFIDVLKLLNVDFRNYVQLKNFESKNSCIPNGEVDKILNHLSQLQSLNEDILEDLRKRIQNWENNPKIADVIVKKGAFLKMYTTYIQNFESQTNYLDECIVKYPKFGKIVREFEATDRCRKLSLKHYMLKPVQRIPQYRLLLNDYLKHLSETSEDYPDTLSALKIVCEVVDHANRNMSHGDKEGRLMHFQSLLSDYELIKPGRELIKDGTLEKICRKTLKERYFILLNDCLLHTTYSKQYLKIHQELPLSGMKICYNDDEKSPSFTVHSITKSFILCGKSETECRNWVETLQKTIEEHIKRQKTFLNVKIEVDTSFKLGKEAPVWVQDSKVTMCQICTAEFTALFRRHHCRGCGKVVCRNCGSNQAPLQYRNFKPDRVCDNCFELLLKDYDDSEENVCQALKEMLNLSEEGAQHEYLSVKAKFIKYTAASNWKKQKYIPPRLKEVSANDSQSVISGWLYRKSRKSWKLFWYVLKDHVLYVYKASEDVLALETIPVLGYEVERAKVNQEDVDKKLIFSLVHPCQRPITFRAESQTTAERWFDALTAATNLDYLTL